MKSQHKIELIVIDYLQLMQGGRRDSRVQEVSDISSGLKAIASQITARTNAVVALFSTSAPIAVVVARAPGQTLDSSRVLRLLMDRFGGRGGGKPELAQGGGLAGELNAMMSAARELLGGA